MSEKFLRTEMLIGKENLTIIDTIYTLIAIRNEKYVDGFHKIEKAIQRKKY